MIKLSLASDHFGRRVHNILQSLNKIIRQATEKRITMIQARCYTNACTSETNFFFQKKQQNESKDYKTLHVIEFSLLSPTSITSLVNIFFSKSNFNHLASLFPSFDMASLFRRCGSTILSPSSFFYLQKFAFFLSFPVFLV